MNGDSDRAARKINVVVVMIIDRIKGGNYLGTQVYVAIGTTASVFAGLDCPRVWLGSQVLTPGAEIRASQDSTSRSYVRASLPTGSSSSFVNF